MLQIQIFVENDKNSSRTTFFIRNFNEISANKCCHKHLIQKFIKNISFGIKSLNFCQSVSCQMAMEIYNPDDIQPTIGNKAKNILRRKID